MKKREYTVAVVGATGAVGAEMIKVLEERSFPAKRVIPLASERSIGREVTCRGESVPVEVLGVDSFKGVDIALFSAGGDVSREFAPVAAASGAVVVDNTSAFRMDPDCPLVVPEVNPGDLAHWERKRIIANPNCSTIQMLVAVAPLHREARATRIVVSTYQAVSGAGIEAMEELSKQAVALFSGGEIRAKVFPHRIAFNCIPQIGKFLEDGSTEEERKMVEETAKIMGDPDLKVAATTVRVPVFCGHSESINVEFADGITPERAREILSEAPGVELVDEPARCRYPLAMEASGKDPVYVGRVRRDPSVENGLAMWVVADNLRKGAALNAVQIAELMIEEHI
ncbi:MAG: aspartate-semialdehyde dehydrogenase [Proteobacteria bacterium]|nr:aspartate-semialdehyde dehydrogenase [Pseudomonadota bacterium]